MLKNLPKLTRDEVKLRNLVAGCLPMAEKAVTWLPGIQEVLSKRIGVACQIDYQRMSIESKPDMTGAVFAITWPPRAGSIWVECDTKTLQSCVYKAIQQPAPEALDPKLSNLESGIVLYLLTGVFESTQEAFQVSNLQEKPQVPLLCLSFKFTLEDQNSYIRLWISPEMLTPSPAASALELGKQRCLSAEIPLRVELGSVLLTQEELAGLEAGDIVVLENSSLKSVQAFVGDPVCATLKGSVSTDEQTKNYSFSIEELS